MNNFNTKWRQAGKHIHVLPQTGRLLWDSAKGWTIAWVAALAVSGVLPIVVMRLMNTLIDNLASLSR
jgi:hypothetical protein